MLRINGKLTWAGYTPAAWKWFWTQQKRIAKPAIHYPFLADCLQQKLYEILQTGGPSVLFGVAGRLGYYTGLFGLFGFAALSNAYKKYHSHRPWYTQSSWRPN